LYAGLGDNPSVYYVHSYEVRPSAPADVAAVADYAGEVTAAVGRGNLHATQFHPEKSQEVGLRILANFTRLTLAAV
jgi:glutamine amidotransferase